MTLYNKYRPKEFEELVGQEFIVTSIKNSISKNSLPHSLLLIGKHGTGKTTIARLIAKEMDIHTNDIHEIDAASRNSKEDIKEISRQCRAYPLNSAKKVYIIDECHMLSKSAFNSFLKLLEEPPSHVLFFLCTTELQELPETIKSRCQLHQLSAIKHKDIYDRLELICDKEEVITSNKVLDYISTNAKGSLRDAISELELLISYSNGDLTKEGLLASIGLVNDSLLDSFIDTFIECSTKDMLIILNKILMVHDPDKFLIQLGDYVRLLFSLRDPNLFALMEDISEERKSVLQAKFKALGPSLLYYILKQINNIEVKADKVYNFKLHIEINFIDLMVKRKQLNAKNNK